MSQIILDSANDLIQGDFDNATLSQRTRLQTSTINATTGVYVVPNGTANAASVQISNAADPTNASKVVLATNGSTDTQIVSGANGSGTYLPLSIYTNNDIRLQVNNSGALGVRTGPGTVGFGTAGQVLTSNGSGAGVSWNTAAGGQMQTQLFTSPGTWTNPGSVTQVRVTVVGGGGGGGSFPGPATGTRGGFGGLAVSTFTIPTSPVAVTVGTGGAGRPGPGPGGVGSAGNTSSFGPFLSATGGGAGGPSPSSPGSPGTGTISAPALPGGLRSTAVGATSGGTDDVNGMGGSIGYINSPFLRNGGGSSAVTYSISSDLGTGGAGAGGLSPVGGTGGVGGAVIVEWVG